MHPFVFILMTIWFTGVIAIGAAGIFLSFHAFFSDARPSFLFGAEIHHENLPRGLFTVLILILCGFHLVRSGVHEEIQYINDFLDITLSQR